MESPSTEGIAAIIRDAGSTAQERAKFQALAFRPADFITYLEALDQGLAGTACNGASCPLVHWVAACLGIEVDTLKVTGAEVFWCPRFTKPALVRTLPSWAREFVRQVDLSTDNNVVTVRALDCLRIMRRIAS